MTVPDKTATIDSAVTIDNQMLGQSLERGPGKQLGDNLSRDTTCAVDFAFLVAQTFADIALERDVLALFVGQMRKVLPTLPGLTARAQADAAHLLKGSARGIGAWAVAGAAEDYESAPPELRHIFLPALIRAFATAEIAIEGRLAALES